MRFSRRSPFQKIDLPSTSSPAALSSAPLLGLTYLVQDRSFNTLTEFLFHFDHIFCARSEGHKISNNLDEFIRAFGNLFF